jgi:hypothetical protein
MLNKVLKEAEKKPVENFFVLIIAIFIIFNIEVSQETANIVDNLIVKVLLYIGVFFLFTTHKLLGAVAFIGVFELIRRSEKKTGKVVIKKYLPTQIKKDKHLNSLNQFPVTLEEEIVSKMVPITNNTPLPTSGFKPTLSSCKGATSI